MSYNLEQPAFIFVLRINNLTFRIMEKRTEQRKHFLHCNIAGFTYWDGCIAFEDLKMGTKLELVREDYNRHDPNAVAVYYKDMKLGFIPKHKNEMISQFIEMGHNDVFEVRVCQIDEEAHPEHQVYINVYIKRKEK